MYIYIYKLQSKIQSTVQVLSYLNRTKSRTYSFSQRNRPILKITIYKNTHNETGTSNTSVYTATKKTNWPF